MGKDLFEGGPPVVGLGLQQLLWEGQWYHFHLYEGCAEFLEWLGDFMLYSIMQLI